LSDSGLKSLHWSHKFESLHWSHKFERFGFEANVQVGRWCGVQRPSSDSLETMCYASARERQYDHSHAWPKAIRLKVLCNGDLSTQYVGGGWSLGDGSDCPWSAYHQREPDGRTRSLPSQPGHLEHRPGISHMQARFPHCHTDSDNPSSRHRHAMNHDATHMRMHLIQMGAVFAMWLCTLISRFFMHDEPTLNA
jgi:hypothetical protein